MREAEECNPQYPSPPLARSLHGQDSSEPEVAHKSRVEWSVPGKRSFVRAQISDLDSGQSSSASRNDITDAMLLRDPNRAGQVGLGGQSWLPARADSMLRRTFCTILILILGVGPLALVFPANSDLRLPACCRRHGAHHCAMSAEGASMLVRASSGHLPALTNRTQCPCFPDSIAASPVTVHALVAQQFCLPAPEAAPHSPAIRRATVHDTVLRSSGSRGPPASNFS